MNASEEKLGRFGHHPEPDIDFEVEVEELVGMAINRRTGFDREPDLERRVERAMGFRVGGVPSCVAAKDDLRKIDAELRSNMADAAPDMLAALRSILDGPTDRMLPIDLEMARAAIAKAEGRSARNIMKLHDETIDALKRV